MFWIKFFRFLNSTLLEYRLEQCSELFWKEIIPTLKQNLSQQNQNEHKNSVK